MTNSIIYIFIWTSLTKTNTRLTRLTSLNEVSIYLAPTTKPTSKPTTTLPPKTTPELTTKRPITIQTTTRSVVKGGIRIPSTKFTGNRLIIMVLEAFLLVIIMECKNQAMV